MLKGISYWSMPHGLEGRLPVREAIALAKSAGFSALELCIGEVGELSVETSRSECERLRAAFEASEIQVETLASGMSWALNPVSNDRAVRSRCHLVHEAALRRASWLGCKAMLYVPAVVCSPIAPNEHVRYDLAVSRAEKGVSRLLDVADEVGVDLCLENVWNGFLYSPLEFMSFIDGFKRGRLGVYFDVGNVMGYQQHPLHWIELLGTRIKRVHIKDFKERFGWQGEYEFCALSSGEVPLASSIEALRARGYDATLVAEMLPWREGLLQQTSEAMDRLLASGAASACAAAAVS